VRGRRGGTVAAATSDSGSDCRACWLGFWLARSPEAPPFCFVWQLSASEAHADTVSANRSMRGCCCHLYKVGRAIMLLNHPACAGGLPKRSPRLLADRQHARSPPVTLCTMRPCPTLGESERREQSGWLTGPQRMAGLLFGRSRPRPQLQGLLRWMLAGKQLLKATRGESSSGRTHQRRASRDGTAHRGARASEIR
jgi:hypothetical protein